MVASSFRYPAKPGYRAQRGIATLLVVLSVLVILTIIILSSSSVALFEQKTATNENRARLAEQTAEYALNLGGEYLKANVSKISTNAAGGWLDAVTAANVRWKSCAAFTDAAFAAASTVDRTHPCYAERNQATRLQLYYFTANGSTVTAGDSTTLNVPYESLMPTGIKLATTGVGGAVAFPATASVRALLCRLDTSLTPPKCQTNPAGGRRIAVTMIAQGDLTNENSSATVKETWGTLPKTAFSASVPLVASGFINFVGTFTVVAAPNAGGYGVPASVWSPKDVTGNGSYQSCHLDDYLGGLPVAKLTTNPGCADNSSCACDTDILSSKTAEGIDTLDKGDSNAPLPDITFFPGKDAAGVRMDNPADFTDDNLFEWIFGVDVTNGNGDVVQTNCPNNLGGANTDCERKAMDDIGFEAIASCAGLNQNSSGLYYYYGPSSGQGCSPGNQVGDSTHSVVIVADDSFTFGHTDLFYGMIFVRSPKTALLPGNTASVKGNAKGMHFGSIVVEGDGRFNGNMDLIYRDTSAGSSNDPLPESTRFARLPGSWLDNRSGF